MSPALSERLELQQLLARLAPIAALGYPVVAVVRSESLGVVGLVEVLAHIPRIYGEFRKLVSAATAS